MTKYRIKDNRIKEALRNLWDLDTFERVNLSHAYLQLVVVNDQKVEEPLIMQRVDLDEVVKYDPKVWNDISKVKPPKQGLYRVEWRDNQGVCRHRDAHWFDGRHFTTAFASMHGPLTAFFKPWDDEE